MSRTCHRSFVETKCDHCRCRMNHHRHFVFRWTLRCCPCSYWPTSHLHARGSHLLYLADCIRSRRLRSTFCCKSCLDFFRRSMCILHRLHDLRVAVVALRQAFNPNNRHNSHDAQTPYFVCVTLYTSCAESKSMYFNS